VSSIIPLKWHPTYPLPAIIKVLINGWVPPAYIAAVAAVMRLRVGKDETQDCMADSDRLFLIFESLSDLKDWRIGMILQFLSGLSKVRPGPLKRDDGWMCEGGLTLGRSYLQSSNTERLPTDSYTP
jgi:hypothetical protein